MGSEVLSSLAAILGPVQWPKTPVNRAPSGVDLGGGDTKF